MSIKSELSPLFELLQTFITRQNNTKMHSSAMNFYKAWSVKSFSDYMREETTNGAFGAVGQDGTLLDYETLELRVHPPNITIDNDSYSDATSVTVECANRPGTLIEVFLNTLIK